MLTPLASQVAVAIENARLYDELVRREMRLDRELAIARDVQHGLLPGGRARRGRAGRRRPTSGPRASWAATSTTSTRSASGVLGLAVGDVAGKGVPAALYGAFASGTVRARAFERHPPADLLYRVNRTLRRRGVEGFFCTLAFALFDFQAAARDARQLRPALSAALPGGDGALRAARVAGLPLGAFEAATYEERVGRAAQPGDVFVFHTDGVSRGLERRRGVRPALRLREQVERARRAVRRLGVGRRILADVADHGTASWPDDPPPWRTSVSRSVKSGRG